MFLYNLFLPHLNCFLEVYTKKKKSWMRHFCRRGAGSRAFGAEPGATASRPGARRVLVTREEAEAIWKLSGSPACSRLWADAHSSGRLDPGSLEMWAWGDLSSRRAGRKGLPLWPADLRAHSHRVPRSQGCVPVGPAAFKCLFPPSSTHSCCRGSPSGARLSVGTGTEV